MGKILDKWWQKLLAALLSAMGLSSCLVEQPDMYGMGPNYAEISGTVTSDEDADGDGENDPIPGIEAKVLDAEGNELSCDVTREDGRFFLDTNKMGSEVTLTFTDIDGEENGLFKSKSEKITLDTIITKRNVTLEPENGDEEVK